jgi:TetR/AcrR family transcriptional regulator
MAAKKTKKKQNDSNKTRERIIAVAVKCFARDGYHGTTVDEIVERAKINKRMVYHYFQDKEGLYQEVHRRGWLELQKNFRKSLEEYQWDKLHEAKAEQTLLVEAMKFLFDFAVEHPLFHRLILLDAMEGGKATRSLWKEIRGPLYADISLLVLGAQQHGLIPEELKVNHLVITSLGLVSFYFTFANSMEEMFGQNPLSPQAVAERKEQVIISFKRMIGIH